MLHCDLAVAQEDSGLLNNIKVDHSKPALCVSDALLLENSGLLYALEKENAVDVLGCFFESIMRVCSVRILRASNRGDRHSSKVPCNVAFSAFNSSLRTHASVSIMDNPISFVLTQPIAVAVLDSYT